MDNDSRVKLIFVMSFNDLKHAQRERLGFLDKCFSWRGWANRRDLMDRFGVSMAQAALDFKAYLARAGKTAPKYDVVKKVYVALPDHRPLAPEETLGDWENVLRANGGERFSELPSLVRTCDPSVFARLNRAIENKEALKIRYISMTTGDQSQQWIAPTCFASDGARIHLRAYSFKHGNFRDYVPIRISPNSSFEKRLLSEPLPLDRDWQTIALITLRPRKGLSQDQARAVRREYGFDGDVLVIKTRKALEFYADRRWGLDQAGARLERLHTKYVEREIDDYSPSDKAGSRTLDR